MRPNSNSPRRQRSLTVINTVKLSAEIRLPVMAVNTMAVRRGRILKNDKRALPMRVPSRSPMTASPPPSSRSARISSQPASTSPPDGPHHSTMGLTEPT